MKKAFLLFFSLFLLCFSFGALYFTISTKVADTGQEMRRDLTEYVAGVAGTSSPTTAFIKLEEKAFSVDVSGLKDWHGQYIAVAYLYSPRLLSKEGTVTAEKPAVKLRFYWKKGSERYELDCEPKPTVDLKKEGEEQRCDLVDGSQKRDGIIVYKITKITGPEYLEKTRIGWWVFKLYSYYKIADGASPAVTVEYSIKFRTDSEKGGGGEFTKWTSTQEELKQLISTATAGEGAKPSVGGDVCEPSIKTISYSGVKTEDPKAFHLANFGDIFSVLSTAGVDCAVKDFYLGLWKTSTIQGQPEIKIDFLPEEIEALDQKGGFWKNVMLNRAAYPEKMYLSARLVNAEGKEFFSEPVEMTFPASGTGPTPTPGTGPTPTPVPLAGCNPCWSVVGCLACIDSAMAGAMN